MARLFGTDGIRGVANVDLRPTMAYALGRATAHRLASEHRSIVVGQDTRQSGDMFVAAITAGATSLGSDGHRVGVVPTPALAFLAGNGSFAAGIMARRLPSNMAKPVAKTVGTIAPPTKP